MVAIVLACAMPASAEAVMGPDGRMDFGVEGIDFPPAVQVNGTSPRTVELLGEAIAGEKRFWFRRAQWVQELGRCKMAQAAPYLRQAMADPEGRVRAQAAAAAAESGLEELLADVEKLMADPDALVRREVVVAADALSRSRVNDSPAVMKGLDDSDQRVVAAAVDSVRVGGEVRALAAKMPSLAETLQVMGLHSLGRARAVDQAGLVAGFLDKSLPLRTAAVEALAAMKATDRLAEVEKRLADEHPTARRVATEALAELAAPDERHRQAMKMLADEDPSVRTAAANLLDPLPHNEAAEALTKLLDDPYRPLHAAIRRALTHPSTEQVKQRVIELSAGLLDNANMRRREDGSYVLGRLRSNVAFEKHLALMNPPMNDPQTVDWLLVTQVAQSMGLIGDQRAAQSLAALAAKAPKGIKVDFSMPMVGSPLDAMGEAFVAAGRLRYAGALEDAKRQVRPSPREIPAQIRAAAIWYIGVVSPEHLDENAALVMSVYGGMEESMDSQLEALKAAGNIKAKSMEDRLKEIGTDVGEVKLRWMAHWAYERVSGQRTPYEPPQRIWKAQVSIEAREQ
jgi:hypothetical protein